MHYVSMLMHCPSAKACKILDFACSMTVSPEVKVHKKDEGNNDMDNSQIPLAATESSQIAEVPARLGLRVETCFRRLRIDVPCLRGCAARAAHQRNQTGILYSAWSHNPVLLLQAAGTLPGGNKKKQQPPYKR
jgi:hypothetical protein